MLPRLRTNVPAQEHLPARSLYTFGISEAELEQRLSRLMFKDDIQLRYRLDGPQVLVKIEALSGGNNALDAATNLIAQELGVFLLGETHATLPEATASALRHARLHLALAESCTGGLIAKLLTDQPGSSAFLERSAVTYANSAKRDMLGVPVKVLMQHGAVSRECAAAMASGVHQRAGTEIALAVTGIAGPDGGSTEKPVGTVFIALTTADGTEVREFIFNGDRAAIRERTAYTALDWIRHVALEQALAPTAPMM